MVLARDNQLPGFWAMRSAWGTGTFRLAGSKGDVQSTARAENELTSKAFLSVPLWNKIYSKHGKHLSDNVWFDIKNITGISAPEAQAVEKDVRKWYLEDVVFVVEKPISKNEDSTSITLLEENNSKPNFEDYKVGSNVNKENFKSNNYQNNFNINETTLEKIPFGKDIIIYLPKGNILKAWEKAQKYMKLYLEDFEEELQNNNNNSNNNGLENSDKLEVEENKEILKV